jgi:KaiC/GvpD/RAD55 family RecA-like ATPase
MYSTHGATPASSLPGGSSYLCLGPPMAGMDELFAALLAPHDEGDAAIAVLTDTDPESFLERMADSDGPVAIVDCSGESRDAEASDDRPVRRVASPADLTSIGIAVSEFLDTFAASGLSVRVGLDSLTTLSVYADRQPLFAFLDALEPRITGNDGIFLATLYTESVETQVRSTVEPVFDGRIELRESRTGSEVRVRSPGEDPTAWEPFDGGHVDSETSATAIERGDTAPTIDSLGDLIRRIERTRLTLSVYNTGEADIGPLRTRMDRFNVNLETVETPEVPEGVAMLHRDEEFLMAEPLGTLLSSLSLDELREHESGLSPIVDHVDSTVTGVSGVGKPLLIRASRMFELLAYRSGRGTIHAGFQELSRFVDDPHVRRLYEGLVGTGIDVHLYGVGNATVPVDGLAVVEDDGAEITESWFVVYDGPTRRGMLLCEEREPGVYDGFWTHRDDLVDEALTYLEATY